MIPENRVEIRLPDPRQTVRTVRMACDHATNARLMVPLPHSPLVGAGLRGGGKPDLVISFVVRPAKPHRAWIESPWLNQGSPQNH
jgi:hypothetical protein